MAQFNANNILGGRFAILKDLGSGISGDVKLGVDVSSGQTFALKLINRAKLNAVAMKNLIREIEIMKVIDHPNILKLHGVESDIVHGSLTYAVLVLELAEGGELFDYLMYSGYFDDRVARSYFRQLVLALEACHALNIFHRDIKPENILLNNHFQLKLADFGLSNYTVRPDALLQTSCGSVTYMAPELVQQQPYHGASTDVWSAACVLFIMLCGGPPFVLASTVDMVYADQAFPADWWFNAICLNRYDRFWAAHLRTFPQMKDNLAAQAFLNKLLRAAPAERLTVLQMKDEPWLNLPVLSDLELYHTMAARKVDVDNRKKVEKEAARLEAIRQTAVDSRKVKRSAAAPPKDTTFQSSSGHSVIYSSLPEELFVAAIHRHCLALDEAATCESGVSGSAEKRLRFTLPGETIVIPEDDICFQTPSTALDIVLHVHTLEASESEDITAVEFVFLKGNKFMFQKFFRSLLDCQIGADKRVCDEFLVLEDSIGMV